MVSASSLETPSFTVLGAPSTRSLASFKPRLVTSRTALMTLILLPPTSVSTTANSVFSSAAAAAPPPATPPPPPPPRRHNRGRGSRNAEGFFHLFHQVGRFEKRQALDFFQYRFDFRHDSDFSSQFSESNFSEPCGQCPTSSRTLTN